MTRLTAAELGVPEEQYAALLWVRDALDPAISDKDLPRWMVFDMNVWMRGTRLDSHLIGTATCEISTAPCGTAACIGGSMELYLLGMHKLPVHEMIPEVLRIAAEEGSHGEIITIGDDSIECPELSPVFENLFHQFAGRPGRESAVAAIDRFLEGSIENPWQIGDLEAA